MQRIYEVMFIVRPDMPDEELDKLIVALESQVTTAGGVVKAKEKMGKRRLAYSLGRFQDGFYVLLTIEGGGVLVHEIERRLRVTEPVLKFITVRMDEEQKRLDKMKKLRDAKKRTVPPPPVAAETVAAPVAPASATEASPGEPTAVTA
jgi:small subunit ribosomal protein S6